jgi:predicted esterase
MRRLVLVLAVLGLALLVASTASAAKPAQLVVAKGSAHLVGSKLIGWFVVANRGEARSVPTVAKVRVRGGKPPFRVLVIWTPRRVTIPSLAPSHAHRVRISAAVSDEFGTERQPIRACVADSCRTIGLLTVKDKWQRSHPAGSPAARSPSATTKAPAPAELGNDIAPPPISTVPAEPIPHPVAEPFFHAGGGAEYWGFIPRSYDATNQTPTTLFVWLHGCGGEAEGDAWVVDPGAEEGVPQDWMTLSLGGRDGGCWNPLAETEPLVMAAIADFETHFNVNRRRIILGGYSSGGDLAYRTAFKHSSTFAGLLIENSAPFRDTEASEAELLGAATTKFPIVHLAHEQDMTYKLGEVEPEIAAVRATGFQVELIVRPGGHSDSHTNPDLLAYLLPHIDDGWLAP